MTGLPIHENALVEVHPGAGSEAPAGLACVHREGSDDRLVLVRYLTLFKCQGEQYGVPPYTVLAMPERHLERD